MTTALTLPEKFNKLDLSLNTDLFERRREIHGSLNALLSQRHVFFIGSPGTAKSLLVRRLADLVDFGQDDEAYFQWLLTKYTTPEEVFGPPSLAALEQGKYERNVEHKMPRAKLVFLDEIFKANSSILNALLTIMNERLFFNNGGVIDTPVSTIFGASNEMPDAEELNALYDRLHFRFEVKPVQESSNFVRMLTNQRTENPDPILTWDEVETAQAEVKKVKIPSDVIDAFNQLRDNLAKEGVEPSERRFFECLAIVQAEAWRDERDTADIDDLRILRDVMWSRREDQKTVERTVLELANPIDKEAHELLERIEKLEGDLNQAIQDADNPKQVAKQAVEIHTKLHKAKDRIDDLEKRAKDAGRKSDVLESLNQKFVTTAKKLMKEGFGMDDENLGLS